MSTSSVPNKVCDKLDSLTRRFWWKPKDQEGRKFLAWRAWDKLCVPKSAGGLGFKKIQRHQQCTIGQLAWMIASKRDSLCMKILRARYMVKNDWLRLEPPKNASPIWRAIEKAKDIIVKGACYLIEDGSSINVWLDPWVP